MRNGNNDREYITKRLNWLIHTEYCIRFFCPDIILSRMVAGYESIHMLWLKANMKLFQLWLLLNLFSVNLFLK